MFATNVGTVDRVFRVVLGLALLAFALAGPADITWKWVGFIGIVPLVTGLFKTCPLYSVVGLSTCSAKTA